MISIREAGAADDAAIEQVRRSSWRAAYAGLIAPEHIQRATSGTSRATSLVPAWRRTLVAVTADPGVISGYVAYGPERSVAGAAGALPALPRPQAGSGGEAAPPAGPQLTPAGLAGQAGEVYALYVEPGRWSTGTGRALMGAALQALTAAGYRQAVLWVLAANRRARRFYEIAGFAADGAVNVLDGLGGVPEVRYARSLPAGSGEPGRPAREA